MPRRKMVPTAQVEAPVSSETSTQEVDNPGGKYTDAPLAPPVSTSPTPEPPMAPRPVNRATVGKAGAKRTVWIFVNRNPFPIMLPHPTDAGSPVVFPPCPDTKVKLGMLDFKLHPYYANYTGFRRSLTQEPAPDYLHLDQRSVEKETGVSAEAPVHDLMRMSPDRIVSYIQSIAEHNPDIAQQIANVLQKRSGKAVTQAPPDA